MSKLYIGYYPNGIFLEIYIKPNMVQFMNYPEAYSEPTQTSAMKIFCKNS